MTRMPHLLALCMLALPPAVVVELPAAAAVSPSRPAPGFGFRAYAEVGNLLDIPDVGYYSDAGPSYVNETRLQSEAAEVRSLLPAITPGGFNAFVLYTPNVEDFVTYEALFPSGHAPAFPAGSRHLARVPVFADAINATLSAFKEAGMKTYLVSFEPSFPAGLDQRINISRFNSPDMEHFLRTKFCELRERIPALDGVTIYAADDWSQRADARFNRSHPVFRGPVEFASFATVLQKALSSCGLELLMQTWTAGALQSDLQDFVNATPADITLVSHLGRSFRDDTTINPVVALCAARKTLVFADAYRENDGWAHGISVPGAWWQTSLQRAKTEGCAGTVLSGSWGPTWTWPSGGPELINASAMDPPKSWAGQYADFRIFTRGFTAQQAAVYLFSKLSIDPEGTNTTAVVSEWAQNPPLSLTGTHADALAPSMLAASSLWAAVDSGPCSHGVNRWQLMLLTIDWQAVATSNISGCILHWTSTLRTANAFLHNTSIALSGSIREDNGPAVAAVLRAATLTELYVRTWTCFQLAVRLSSVAEPSQCSRQRKVLADITVALEQWRRDFRRESVAFQIGELDPLLYSRPEFWPTDNNRSLAIVTTQLQTKFARCCSTAKPPASCTLHPPSPGLKVGYECQGPAGSFRCVQLEGGRLNATCDGQCVALAAKEWLASVGNGKDPDNWKVHTGAAPPGSKGTQTTLTALRDTTLKKSEIFSGKLAPAEKLQVEKGAVWEGVQQMNGEYWLVRHP